MSFSALFYAFSVDNSVLIIMARLFSADVALSQRLAEELKYENEAAAPADPEFLKAFKAQGTWAVSLRALSFAQTSTE